MRLVSGETTDPASHREALAGDKMLRKCWLSKAVLMTAIYTTNALSISAQLS